MASIRKHPNSKYYSACFTNAKGVRTTRSTKCTKPGDALKAAVQFERAATAARAKQLTANQARKIIAEFVRDSSGEEMQHHTIKSWLTDFENAKDGTTSPATLTRYKQVNRDFLAFLGKRETAPLASITPADIQRFRSHLRDGGRAISTVNMVLKKVLSVPFTKAKTVGLIEINPCAGLDKLKDDVAAKDSSREPFTIEQIRLLLSAADEDWKGAVLLGWTTGLRLRDIATLKWEAVKMEKGTIELETGKTGSEVILPIHPLVKDWLGKRQRGIGKAWVFPEFATKGTGGRFGLSGRFKAVMEKAGIAEKVGRSRKENGKGRTTSRLSFHSLRHSFVSQLMAAGIHQDIRMKLAGHSDKKSNDIYSHAEVALLADAVGKLAL